MDKNTLNKLLEEKKLAEALMNDEEFKSKAKGILKKENPNITDKDIMNILKATEKVLSGEVKIKNDEDLDEVAGGGIGKSIVRKTIKTVCTAGGTLGGGIVGGSAGLVAGYKSGESVFSELGADSVLGSDIGGIFGSGVGSGLGGLGGGIGGYEFGNFLCNKLGLND